MKLIVRADDFGYTNIFNQGTMKAVEEGIVTYVDLMLDCPGLEDAIERIKNYPWITVGWHGGHFWGKPAADPQKIGSLLDETGRFKFRVNQKLKNEIDFEEAVIECRAQIERCFQLLKRVPEVTSLGNTVFDQARKQVCDEYGIAYDIMRKKDRITGIVSQPAEKYQNLGIFMPTQHESVYKILYSDYAEERQKYDPVQYFIDDPDQLMKENIVITAWHPGYLDDTIYFDSSKHFNLARVIDIQALCDPCLKRWIKENQVELINVHDALYGTHQYQEHLKEIGSELYLG